jgi:hypothetical protein
LERLAQERLVLLLRLELPAEQVMCLWRPHYQMEDPLFMLMVVVVVQLVVVVVVVVN